jgi:hypothetical protein
MTPMFADSIDIPFVLGIGVAVLVPLIAFETFVEAWVLRGIWRQRFGELCRFTFVANCLSLAAGIPAKILNMWLYSFLLPDDLPGFFSNYPFALAVGSLSYFAITLGVEGTYAFRWLRLNQCLLPRGTVWKGVLIANLATYAVLAPLHYFATRPMHQIREFTRNARWTVHPATKVLFTDSDSAQLKSIHLDGSELETIVPMAVRDYLVSENLNLCLFRGADGSLRFFRRDSGQSNLVWQTHERYQMNQVAFSPSGQRVAFAAKEGNYLEVLDVQDGKRVHQALLAAFKNYDGPSLAWSRDEKKFYLGGFESNSSMSVTIQPDLTLTFDPVNTTNEIALWPCYGRASGAEWYGSDDWGHLYHDDSCGDLRVWTEPGLGSGLRIYREDPDRKPVLYLNVNPGLLHIARFDFGDVAFLEDCRECLFEANEYIYLLDIEEKRVGTVARGERFILLTDRYQKHL